MKADTKPNSQSGSPTLHPDTDGAKWISAASFARLLGVSARSIQRRCRAGTLPARRVQGERGEVWEVEATAAQAIQNERDNDGDSATQKSATATATRATQGRSVALILPLSSSKSATDEGDSDGDSATLQRDSATLQRDSDGDTPQSVALESERLRAQLEASRAETERERELNRFLKSQIEEGNRNAAELRAALRKALEIAPRQLTAGRTDESAQNGAAGKHRQSDPNNAGTGAQSQGQKDAETIDPDELLELCRRIHQ